MDQTEIKLQPEYTRSAIKIKSVVDNINTTDIETSIYPGDDLNKYSYIYINTHCYINNIKQKIDLVSIQCTGDGRFLLNIYFPEVYKATITKSSFVLKTYNDIDELITLLKEKLPGLIKIAKEVINEQITQYLMLYNDYNVKTKMLLL